MDSNDYKSLVLYNGRLRFYNSMQKIALEGLAKFPTQSEFRLFNGFALALGSRMQECIRELNPLKNESELGLAATITLIYAHKHCHLQDLDALHSLERRIENEKNTTISAPSCYYIAVFLFLIGEFDETLDYIDRSLKIYPHFDAAMLLKIWCELSSCLERPANAKLQNVLEGCIARSNGKNIDATLALVRFYQKRRQFEQALLLINKLSIRFPDICVPLIEKMETQMAALDWDFSLDTALRVINMESFNIAALRFKGLLHIVRESNMKAGAATLQQLLSSLELIEPGNNTLLIEICQLFSRICSKNFELLKITSRCIEEVIDLNSKNVSHLNELGHQKLLLNNVADAEIAFRTACNIDSTNIEALCGLTLCKLKTFRDGESMQQIRQQLAYLTKLTDNKPEPMVLYMSALLAEPKNKQFSLVQLLVKAADIHLKKFSFYPFGVEYICIMNPDFMLMLCEELIRHSPAPMREFYYDLNLGQESLHTTLKHSVNILEIILNICPGHQGALFLRAKVDFLCGEYSKAISRLQHILKLFGNTFKEAHILLAQILTETKQYSKALEYLELALAQSFEVREQPMYHLLKGIILKNQHKLSEAHQCFIFAFELIGGMSTSLHLNSFASQAQNTLASSDRMTLYIELIYVLRDLRDAHGTYESERILQFAVEEFNGTPEIGRLIIAQSQLALEKCNVAEAISLLSTIRKDQSFFMQARIHLANIYLKHQKNRCAFAKCFNELVDAQPESKSFLMLGEAFLSIQETDLAINAYKKACEICPSNILLIRKLGRAYVKSHDYAKALKYYHEIIQNPECSALKLDLAELFLQLKQYNNAVKILTDTYTDNTTDGSFTELQLRTKQLLLLARVYEKSGNNFESLTTLQDARDNQYRVRKLCSLEQPDSLNEQSKILSKICILNAQQAVKMKNSELALDHFKQCIKYALNDIEILVSLAQLAMQSKEMDMCRNTCLKVLQLDGSNETALVLMADLSFRKMEFKNAAYHFSQLILSQPCNWTALTRLIEVMRRSGTLSESVPFLQRAEQSVKCNSSAGLNYCKGLFEWYNGNFNCALRYFNVARRNQVWGQKAKLNMIEICINPDDEIMIANDLFEVGDSGELSDSRIIALQTADRLLKEMRPCSGEIFESALTRRVLWNFLQIASKQKVQVESALKDLTELMQNEGSQQNVTAVYATALALIQLKQIQRAKNQLKRIARLNWSYEESEYLERSWLLLADIYIHANKLDVAESYVERALEYNKSSTKAYELAGYIAEKLQSYGDAAEQFQKAWNSSGRSKPNVGYRLALSNMKGKNYVSAVNVCQQVLKLHPDFIIIRKDILEKCRNNLRN